MSVFSAPALAWLAAKLVLVEGSELQRFEVFVFLLFDSLYLFLNYYSTFMNVGEATITTQVLVHC